MPNHVTTILTVSGDDAQNQAMFEAIKNDKVGIGSLDFSKVIPFPDNIYQGNLGSEERAKYGKDNWYDWNIDHWGTKWNSYDVRRPKSIARQYRHYDQFCFVQQTDTQPALEGSEGRNA